MGNIIHPKRTGMAGELHDTLPALNVPERTRQVAGRRDDLAVPEKAAARQISSVARQLLTHTHLPVTIATCRPKHTQTKCTNTLQDTIQRSMLRLLTTPSRSELRLKMEQMLSSPPQATKFPEGAYAHVMTHEERRGIAWTLLAVYASLQNELEKKKNSPDDQLAILRSTHEIAVV